jgi:hypothetical protein
VDILHTDVHLSDFIEGLKKRQQGITALAEPAAEQPAPAAPACTPVAPEPAFLLPPRDPRHQVGRRHAGDALVRRCTGACMHPLWLPGEHLPTRAFPACRAHCCLSIVSAGTTRRVESAAERVSRSLRLLQDGRMTVLLDLDGTLVSSFSPKRAPALPPSVRTHYVGHGSQLNPQGVFVVERPGLHVFLEELSQFSEVVIFTAGR